MSAAEYAALAAVCFAFAIGALLGHATGYARRGDVERRRQHAALTGGPKYRRGITTYTVETPSGIFYQGPHKPSAEAFADKYGGVVNVVSSK